MIKNAVISTREELMMSNASLYHEFLNNYDVDNSIRVFIGGGGGGSISTTKQPIYTERPTCTPIIPTITPSDKPTTIIKRPIKPIDPFPEIVIGYIVKDKPTLDWDVFKTYDIPDSNQYVEYDTYTYTFKKFDKLENATAYWTDFLQDKTVIDNSIKRLEQKKSNKIWDFYSYNIDNSYISKLYDEMYMSFTNVRRFNEISQNIIKSFDQYTEKTDLISFEFEGLSEFETNIIETSGSADVTKGKLNIRVKHKKLKNIDYYVTATNGVHVDYDGTIYFANNNVSYVTAYLSADPSICKTVAVKPSQLVKIPGEKDLINSNEIHACLKSYNAHRVLRPLTVNSPVMFNETYHESVILHGNWNLMDELGHSDDYYCKIEFNVGGEYKLCTKAEPIIRTSEFNSIHIAYANRMYIHGDVSVIDDTHLRLNLTALDLTARQFNASESTYRITIFKYERDSNNKITKETKDLVTFNAFLSCKSLFPTGALRPKFRLVNPLNLISSGIENNKDVFSKSYKVAQNSIITITSRDSSSKLVSLSIEPANGNATSLVPKVKRNGDEYYIYCVGKGSYKINYSLYNESDNYIDDTDTYSIIISESLCSVNKDFDTLTDSNLNIKSFIEIDKAGLKCELNIKDKIIPASIIAQFNTYDDAARTRGNNFASELDIKYIYTDYDYSNIDSGKLNFTIWYENSGFESVAPLRIYLINVDNSIIYKDYTPLSNAKSRIVSRAFMFFGLIDDFTDYGKDLNQELYAISKQNKISGFIKVSLGLSDKPWTSSLKIKEPVRPIYDPFITNLQNKFIAKFTPTQVSYINRIRKTIQNTSLQTTRINDYLKSQNLTISNPTSSVLLNNKLSYLSEIDSKKQISDLSIFDTAALGLSIIGEDNDTLSPWNVSPQITIDNPTVYYDLNEYYGKVRRGCMYKTTEKNYDLNIGKSTKFDTDLDTVGITISISKTDQIKIEFSFEQIYAMIDGNKEDIYCIDKNSLKIAGTIDGKRVELKYVNGCSWNKTTGKVIISEDKSFNLVFGVLNSRKRINLTFVIDEYYQILDDIVIEDYDTCCTNGKPLSESPLLNLGGVKFNTTYTFLSSLNVDNIKSEISKDKYAYSHIWVDPNILSRYTIVTNLIDSSIKIKKPTIVSNEDAGISTASAEPKDLFFGSFSVRNNNLIFEKNYVYKPIANIELIQPPKLAFRYVSDENIKWLVEDARQLNLLEDHDYDICLNLGKVNDDNKDDQYTTNLETNTYNIRILCKNKLILIASNVNKFSSFTFNYKKNYDKHGFITALCIFDSNDDLVRTYMLNTSFFPYTKATIVLERIHQTPIYYYNDALSEYKENGDYDNLLPSFTFYKDKANQKMLCNDVQSYCSTYMGLISAMPLRFKTNFDTLVNNMSISVLNNKVCAIQHKDNNNIHSYSYILGKTLSGSGIEQVIKITNYLELSGKNILIDDKSNEKEIISKQTPDTIQYIGYMMYYYNMLYLRNLGWEMNDDCDSEDMIYYMIMLDKLKHKDKIFSAFRKNLFDDNGKAIYGNQIDIYDSNFADKLNWKTTIGYVEYFNKFKNNILKYWEDRIDAYNILEEVLGEYDSKLTVTEQIDKYLDILGDDGTKRKKIYFILTTETGEDKWAVSQINNRIYQQDAFYYIWSNVYQIMFDGVFDFDLINDAIIKDIYNFGLYPEIEIPEMTDEGLFVPYKINRNGKIEESFEIKNNKKEYVWDGSEDEKYKYILDENNFIIGINADIDLTESEQNVRYWEFSQLSDFNGWGSYEIDGADGKGWGKLSKDGKEYVLTIKGKIVERTKRKNYLSVYHQKENSEKNGKRYTTYRRRLDSKAPQTVHATYFGDCKEYWLDENKCNIIKTNKRSLITGIRLQRFLCELFISELNKTTYMVDVIQKFFEINNALGRLREDWRSILNNKNEDLTPFDKEIKYPLVDFNLKEFKFERKCIYPEDRTLRGALSYTFDYYCWDDHKIKSEEGSNELNIDIPEYSIQRQIIHESQIYDDYFTLSITVPQNTGIYRKGIGKSFTYILEDNDKKYLSYISFVTDQKHTTQISLTQLNIGEDNKNSYYNTIYGVEVIPDESTGIEPFIIYPWNINRNTSLTIDNDDNNNLTTYSNLYDSAIWSSSITDLSGLPNFDDYDRLSRYIDIDSSGLRNSEVIMSRIKSGELKDAPATELCYNYDAYEFIKSDKHNSISKTQLQTYTYTVKYFKGFEYSPKFSYYTAFAYNKITNQTLEVNYIPNSEAKKYPLCEYEIKDNSVTYTYKYVLPNILYRLTYSYNTNAYQTIYSYYDKFHIKYKEEKHLGTAKPPIYKLPGEKSISELSVSNNGISAMSLDAGISVTSEVPFENKNERLFLTVNRLDELMLHDNTFINNRNRINKSETKIIATVEPREIESDKFITIPPIITRPVPTFRPTLIPTITIAPTLKPTIIPIKPTEKPTSTEKPTENPPISIFKNDDIKTIIEKSSIYQVTVNKPKESDIKYSYYIQNIETINRKVFSDYRLKKYIGSDCDNIGDAIIQDYINELIMKNGFNEIVIGVTYYNKKNFIEFVINNDVEVIDKDKHLKDDLRKYLGFYLGSVSQWQIVQDNVIRINAVLKKIDDELHKPNSSYYPKVDYFYEGRYVDNRYDNRLFWTSSEKDKDEAWPMFFDRYYCGLNNKLTSAYVRPFMTYKGPKSSKIISVETKKDGE